jgi:hypothetical protein
MKPFASSQLKIERANKHIADIKTFIAALPDRYTVTIEKDPNTGNPVIKHDLRGRDTVATDLAVIIGDAVHNLNCALDHAWVTLIKRFVPSAVTKFSKFPIYETEDKLKIALHGAKVDSTAPELFEFIVADIQPYMRGNHTLWFIHRLDILDKHRLLIPVLQMAAIDGVVLENERGSREFVSGWGSLEKAPYFMAIESGWHIKHNGHVSVAIIFDERTPLYGMDVPDMLSTFATKTLNVVGLLEQRFYDPAI